MYISLNYIQTTDSLKTLSTNGEKQKIAIIFSFSHLQSFGFSNIEIYNIVLASITEF